ncbi:hypothetical protein M0802_001242 [Mischocyttarus mexicanus]|nr:hypothetical protein M0802_001242 [Mischocyttarus mexicanus]
MRERVGHASYRRSQLETAPPVSDVRTNRFSPVKMADVQVEGEDWMKEKEVEVEEEDEVEEEEESSRANVEGTLAFKNIYGSPTGIVPSATLNKYKPAVPW